ncbi:hydrogenase expression/formation protein HypC [Catenulispora sp. GP43]|uniref:HypC/HybG/HupF family hydrogenase formation chaperone n=1 Tax=Catenulispora sp. GP43 TaxID=3156263 RepID=UPI003512B782
MCLAIPGRLESVEPADPFPTGTADFGGIRKQVCLVFVPEAAIGDYVLVHVGFAIGVIDEAEALRTLAVLRAMGDVVETELAGGVS